MRLTNTAQNSGIERGRSRADGDKRNTAEKPEQTESNNIDNAAQSTEKVVFWVKNSFPVHKNASFLQMLFNSYILPDRKEIV